MVSWRSSKRRSLQNSHSRVQIPPTPWFPEHKGEWRNGLRRGLKILGSQELVGSNPTSPICENFRMIRENCPKIFTDLMKSGIRRVFQKANVFAF